MWLTGDQEATEGSDLLLLLLLLSLSLKLNKEQSAEGKRRTGKRGHSCLTSDVKMAAEISTEIHLHQLFTN